MFLGGEGIADLVDFDFQPLEVFFVQVAETDGSNLVRPQEPEPQEHGPAHIPQGQDVHPFLGREHRPSSQG